MKALVLGLGNPIVTDDGVGLDVARRIKEQNPDLEVEETCEVGLALLDYIAGYDKVVIIDSIKTGKSKPGNIFKLTLDGLGKTSDLSCSHGIDIASAFKVGQGLGYKIPQHISIYAIEVKDNSTFGEGCTPEVESQIPSIARRIVREEKL